MLIVILVLLTMALPLFLYGTFYVARGILHGLRTTNWSETSGVILFSNIERYYRGKDVAKEVLQLSYHYMVDGVTHEGNRMAFKSFAWFFGDLKKLAAQYAKDPTSALPLPLCRKSFFGKRIGHPGQGRTELLPGSVEST